MLKEVSSLYAKGFAIHWLRPKSKWPVEAGWTTGNRADWDTLKKKFKLEYNAGVRLGKASSLKDGGFLAVIDADIKGEQDKYWPEVKAKLRELHPDIAQYPQVLSGRGNGSRHFYFQTKKPQTPFRFAQSSEKVKVHMPSVRVTRFEIKNLTPSEIQAGLRLRPAWEISIMGEGQQVVLPPSIHPDSGKAYKWRREINGTIPVLEIKTPEPKNKMGEIETGGLSFPPVDLKKLPDHIAKMIEHGDGVSDRSASLFRCAIFMVKEGFKDNEILSVLTDSRYFLGLAAFEHAQTKNRKRAAAWIHKYTLQKARFECSAEKDFEDAVDVEEVKLDPKTAALQSKEILANGWRNHIERQGGKEDAPPKGTLKNLVLILNSALGENIFERDEFASRDFYKKDTPWGGKKGASLNDEDVIEIVQWLANHFRFEPSKSVVSDAMTVLARRNTVHPVREMLEKLEWDGKDRLEGAFKRYLGARAPEPYLSQVSMKFFMSLIYRVYQPGFKVDYMPIFEGTQGIGKSSFGRILVGDAWFADSLPDLADKDAALNLQGTWLVEMGELAHMRRSEVETVKSFISRQVDRVRPPYGKRWLELPRQCVFLGTTNNDQYLQDKTGNRRYWPIAVSQCDFKSLRADRLQLLAEAKWIYDNLESLRFIELEGDEAKSQAIKMQRSRMTEDEADYFEDLIREKMEKDKKAPKSERFHWQKFKLNTLFKDSASLSAGVLQGFNPTAKNIQFVTFALKKIGFKRYRANGENYWIWPRP